MAKSGTSKDKRASGSSKAEDAAGWTDSISDALKDASKRASDLAQNPYARSLLAAGLVAAAAALASNKNVRDVTRRNLRAATEAVEVGADNAGQIGVAIVNAATDAVQALLSLTGAASSAAAAAKPAADAKPKPAEKKPATSRAAGKPAAVKPTAVKASATKAAPRARKAAATRAKPATKPKS